MDSKSSSKEPVVVLSRSHCQGSSRVERTKHNKAKSESMCLLAERL